MSAIERCGRCGALVSGEQEWCGQCYAPVAPAAASETTVRGAIMGQLASEAIESAEPDPAPVYSRWRGGPTSFGPATKVILTALVVALGWVVYKSFALVDGPMVGADIGIYAVAAYFFLRQIWKRARVC
jgi:hypothetical protein